VFCDVLVESPTTGQLEDSGEDIKVENWATSAVCANGDRYGLAGWVNNSWYVVAEDCNDEGSTLQSASFASTVNSARDAIDLNNDPAAVASVVPDAGYTLGVAIP
jgi:hypothetical protein